MIREIPGTPSNIAAFVALDLVTREDFEQVVMPRVQQVVEQYGELNYLLKLDTELGNFSIGAWLQDAILGLKHITQWKRAAIITDDKGIQDFTSLFSKIMPGEFRAFPQAGLEEAIQWAATGTI